MYILQMLLESFLGGKCCPGCTSVPLTLSRSAESGLQKISILAILNRWDSSCRDSWQLFVSWRRAVKSKLFRIRDWCWRVVASETKIVNIKIPRCLKIVNRWDEWTFNFGIACGIREGKIAIGWGRGEVWGMMERFLIGTSENALSAQQGSSCREWSLTNFEQCPNLSRHSLIR